MKLFMTSNIEPFVVIDYGYFLNISIRLWGICCSGSTVPREGFDSTVIMLFILVCCGCDTSYIVSVNIQCQAPMYTLSLCRGHSWRLLLAKQETLTPPGHLVSPLFYTGPWMSTVVLYCWCHSDSASVLFILHFCHTCSLCRVELLVQLPARGSTQLLLCFFPGVLWLCHFLYSVGPHPVSSPYINTFVVSRALFAGVASQAGDADSSRAPGLTSGLQGSVNVHRGDLLLVPQWQCISCFVLYIQYFSLSGVLTIYVMSNSSELHLRLPRIFVFSIDGY